MSGLSTDRLIEGLLAGVAAGSGGRGASFGARMAVCTAFAVLALVAAGFLIAAAYMALAQALPPAMAAALVGAAALLLAGLLALGLWVYDRARRRRTHAHGAGDAAGAQGLALLEIVADEVRDHPQAAAHWRHHHMAVHRSHRAAENAAGPGQCQMVSPFRLKRDIDSGGFKQLSAPRTAGNNQLVCIHRALFSDGLRRHLSASDAGDPGLLKASTRLHEAFEQPLHQMVGVPYLVRRG